MDRLTKTSSRYKLDSIQFMSKRKKKLSDYKKGLIKPEQKECINTNILAQSLSSNGTM